MALFGRFDPDLIPGKSICIDGRGGWEEGRFGGESGKFCPPSSHYPERGGGIIIDGISTANRVIQREEGWRALWRRSQRLGSARPPDNACLRGRANGRRQRRLSASPAGSGRIPRASENPGLEEDAEL